jgi:hypothetical protein
MPRPRKPGPSDTEAQRCRAWIRELAPECGLTLRQLGDANHILKNKRSKYWAHNALDEAHPLPWETLEELVLRLYFHPKAKPGPKTRALKPLVRDLLLYRSARNDPAPVRPFAIVFEGESPTLAREIARTVRNVPGVSKAVARRLESAVYDYLAPYEQLWVTAIGERLRAVLGREFGDGFEVVLAPHAPHPFAA